MILSQKAYRAKLVYLFALFLTLLLPLATLADCGQAAPPLYESLNLGIPAAALQSPVKGPLPDTTELHVGITFKVDPQVLIPISVLRDHSKMGEVSHRTETLRVGFQLIESFTHPINHGIKRGKSEIRELFFA